VDLHLRPAFIAERVRESLHRYEAAVG
jgi:hypothetical protein